MHLSTRSSCRGFEYNEAQLREALLEAANEFVGVYRAASAKAD